MTRSHALQTAAAYFDNGRFFNDLQRRVALRTECDTGSVPPALDAYLRDELMPRLAQQGFDCRIVANPDPRGG
ncbi:MAG: M20 peptidase family dipeptidase, partial [Comamonadaceae bacterium]